MSENIENMDFVKTEKISKERRVVGAHFDTGCDYLLPDYMGDLKKILSFKAITSPESGYVNGDAVISVNGIVEVRVLYLDSENKLTEARIEKDYEYEIKCSKDVINAYAEPEVVNLSVRAQGPRKLSLKMSICPVTYVIEESSLDMPIIPKDARVLEKSFKLHKADYLDVKEIEYAEAEELMGITCEEVRVIAYDGRVAVVNSEITEEGIIVNTSLHLSAIIQIGNDSPMEIKKKIDNREVIPYDKEIGETEDLSPSVSGYISSLKVTENNVSRDDGTVGCSIVFNFIVSYFARVDGNDTITLIEDAYIPRRRSDEVYSSATFTKFASKLCKTIPLSYEIEREELFPQGACEIIELDCLPKILSQRCEGDKLNIEGVMTFNIISKGMPSGDIFQAKLTRPMAISEKLKENFGGVTHCSPKIELLTLNCTLDASYIYINSEIVFQANLFSDDKTEYLSELSLGDVIGDKDQCKIRVYYPEPSDTLWSVAKKYRALPNQIAEDNGISVNAENIDQASASLKLFEPVVITEI